MKDFAKSIRTMNSNKEEIIKKKKEEGATLKVDNGQKLEFSDGTTFVKTSFSSDYREAHNHVGNEDKSDIIRAAKNLLADAKKFGWAELGYNGWTKKDVEHLEKRIKEMELEQKQKTGNKKVGNEAIVLKDGDVWVVLYANETKSKEFDSEAEARAFAKQIGNKKVGNGYIGQYAKTATERKFDDLLSEIEEGADIVAEFTFMSANASSARSNLDKIIQSANQAKQLLSKLEQEPNSIFNRDK